MDGSAPVRHGVPITTALENGTIVTMQSRNIKLSKPQWHTKFREEYASQRDAEIAAYVWRKKGIPLLANEVGEARKRRTDLQDKSNQTQAEFRI